ncbi:MAG TPA: hypothetical protein IAC46_04600 [Candidatus Onthoplasma faecigallinarum]|nr:hypothetical protein [Candidatus Onthoplasma faecigallinarum]
MAKIKILKKLPKNKKITKKSTNIQHSNNNYYDKNKEKYLEYYDDIKIPSKRYDW